MNTQGIINKKQWTANYVFSTIINCFLKEHTCWHKFNHVPQHDPALASYMNESANFELIKIKDASSEKEIYCAVDYFSPTGRHVFRFPIISRNSREDAFGNISLADFIAFVEQINDAENTVLADRVQDSLANTNTYINYAESTGKLKTINKAIQSFIEAEQSLLLGHQMHPVAKSRMGFNETALIQYSPECSESFQLHYFLAVPNIVNEQSTLETPVSSVLKETLLKDAATSQTIKDLINNNNDTIIPCHPWEAMHLMNDAQVQKLLLKGHLKYLGEAGPLFTPTSSVRTVYSKDFPYMFKFSLHVKITNSERVNLERELWRGYDISRLMKTAWGINLAADYPQLEFVSDPGFFMIKGEDNAWIEGFNTVVRINSFYKEAANRNVSLIAGLSQDGIYNQPARIKNIIENIAGNTDVSIEEAAINWMRKYVQVSVIPLVGIYNQYGLACEAHQQNVLLEMDAIGYPAKLLFRDNQGYFFRDGKADELLTHVSDLAERSMSIVPEEMIHPKYTYYILYNNILGLINAFGVNKLISEYSLLDIVAEELEAIRFKDSTGFVHYMLNARDWYLKSNLVTTIRNMDEARQPIENPAVYSDYPNPFMYRYCCNGLIKPKTKDVLYVKYFAEQDITITLRAFDMSKDLSMLHGWFNMEHTKAFWKMDGPIRELEEFYIMLMDSDHSHSFVGEINGEATFTMEPYWPMRDSVGKYYDALPTDFGAHLLIAPTDKNKKYTMQLIQVVMEYIFNQPEVGKCIGEADVKAKPMHMLITRVGFKFQKVIEMPHKTANLTFCEREWYKEKFPNASILEPALSDLV